MKSKYGFIRFDNISEFKTWLNNKKITRTIKTLQVHHTWSPDYSCFFKGKSTEDELSRQKSMKDYHVNHNGWNDIAQQITIFPNGKIVTGRDLNKTPIGIKGWNTNSVCIEIYGNFDKGHDVMKQEQREAVIACYALLCKKLNITPSHYTIRPHCHFTAGGTYIGEYISSRSAKTCPGTNFMGIGNSKSAMTVFIGWIKEYMINDTSSGINISNTTTQEPTIKLEADNNVKELQDVLNKAYRLNLAVDGLLGPATKKAISNHILKNGKTGKHVEYIQNKFKQLGYTIEVDGSYGPNTTAICKKFQQDNNLSVDGIAGLNTHKAIINKLKTLTSSNIYYRCITSSYLNKNTAQLETAKLKTNGYNAFLVAFEKDGKTYYRVVAKSTNDKSEADNTIAELKKLGYRDSFISVYKK